MQMLEISAQKHSIIIDVTGSDVNITADKQMLEELIYNLCDNAIRYNNPGGKVKVSVYTRQNNGVTENVIEVADNGIGIPKEHQDRIFERFYRVDKSRSKSTGGTGLGLAIVKHIAEMPNIKIEGLFTHLSCADTTDKAYTESQMKRYDSFVELLDEAEIEIPVRHICNSAAIMEYDDHRYDMARAGIILYGLYPSDEVDFSNLELIPAMSWYSHVVNIMEPEMERGVSYGATYVVDHPCRLATVSVGYADGYARSLSNKGWVLIHGQKAPIVGRVCMDQMMVDITDIPDVKLEDIVTLIGKDGDNYISVEDMANLAGSFNYEFVCDVGKRVPRVYKR